MPPSRLLAIVALVLFSASVALTLAILAGCHHAEHGIAGIITNNASCSLDGPLAHLMVWKATFFSFVLGAAVFGLVALSVHRRFGQAAGVSREREVRYRQDHRIDPVSPNPKLFDPILACLRRGVIAGRREDPSLA